MKFRVITLSTAAVAASVILSGCCCKSACKFAVGSPREKVTITKAAAKVKVDGVINEKEWKGAPVYKMARAYAYHSPYATPAKVYDHVSRKGHEVEPFQGGTVRIMYDKNFLYVAAELTDSDINNIAKADQEKLNGTGDVLMVYLKPADSPSFWECQLSPNSKKATFFFPTRGYPINPDANTIMPKMKAAAKVQGTINNYKKADKGWTVEAAIPVSQLKKAGCEFKPGKNWTILIARNNCNFNSIEVTPQYSSYPELPSNNFTGIEYYADIVWK